MKHFRHVTLVCYTDSDHLTAHFIRMITVLENDQHKKLLHRSKRYKVTQSSAKRLAGLCYDLAVESNGYRLTPCQRGDSAGWNLSGHTSPDHVRRYQNLS